MNEFYLLGGYVHRSAWLRKNSPQKVRQFWETVGVDLLICTPLSIRKRWFRTGYIPSLGEVLHVIRRRRKILGLRPIPEFCSQNPKLIRSAKAVRQRYRPRWRGRLRET